MLTIGQRLPEFKLQSVISLDPDNAFADVAHDTYKGKWLVLFSWPKDFTFVCPTEISEFGRLNDEFKSRNAQVLGFSTDSEFVHLAWRKSHPDLRGRPFPMLADIKRELSQALGVLDEQAGVAQRSTFVVDPLGVIRFVMVTDMAVGRNVEEILRILDALQTGGLCPCNWRKGADTIDVQSAMSAG